MSTLTVKELAAPTGYDLKIAAGETLDLNSQGTVILPTIPSNKMPTGSVLQVVQGTTNTQTTTGQTSYVDTGLSAAITPSSTSSKILILVSQNIVFKTDTASEREVYFNIVRDSTQLIIASSTSDTDTSSQLKTGVFNGLSFLDSPNTTSATTYKTQFKLTAQQADIYAQTNSTNSNITLMEIAG